MNLLDELKDRHAKLSKELDEALEREEALHQQVLDLEKAIGGIDPSFWEEDEFDDCDSGDSFRRLSPTVCRRRDKPTSATASA